MIFAMILRLGYQRQRSKAYPSTLGSWVEGEGEVDAIYDKSSDLVEGSDDNLNAQSMYFGSCAASGMELVKLILGA
jgi:hypothetical protein